MLAVRPRPLLKDRIARRRISGITVQPCVDMFRSNRNHAAIVVLPRALFAIVAQEPLVFCANGDDAYAQAECKENSEALQPL
jgi:hypothetical protein